MLQLVEMLQVTKERALAHLVGVVVPDSNAHVGKSPGQVFPVRRWNEGFVLLNG